MTTRNETDWLSPVRRALQPLALHLADTLTGQGADQPADRRLQRAADTLRRGGGRDDGPVGRIGAMIDGLRLIPDPGAEAALLVEMTERRAPLRVGFLNAHAVNLAWGDAAVAEAFLGLDVLLRDGVGLEIALSKLGRDPGLNMNGTDLIPKVLAAGRGQPLAIYGTEDPWLGLAAERLGAEGHDVVDRAHGFHELDAYGDRVLSSRPEIVLLAMGMPKQERVARALPPEGSVAAPLVLCGGAIVDFLADRHSRAPEWIRRRKLEWVWRLLSEPRRLFRRYVIGNGAFLFRTAFLPGRPGARMVASLLELARTRRPEGGP